VNKPMKVADEIAAMDATNTSLATALVRALSEIEGVTKDKVNPHFKSKYADLSSVLETVRPVFARYNMAVTQETAPSEDGVIVETVVLHMSGEERRFGKLYVPANKRDAQGAGSALTYARRYSLMTALGIPAEDDDGNEAVSRMGPAKTGTERTFAKPSEDGGNPTGERLPGDMSDSALRGCIKTLVHNLNGVSSLQEYEELLELEDAAKTIEQCRRRFPAWWETGAGCPAEFKPLKKILEETRKGLADLENA
jgi:hypothetical protein